MVLVLAAAGGCEAMDPLDALTSGTGGAGWPPDSGVSDASGDDASPSAAGDATDDAAAPDARAEAGGATDAADERDAPQPLADAGNDAAADASPPPPIAFVQVAVATPAGTAASVAATYAHAQLGGDLDVVVVGWNDTTSTVTSVTDLAGNTYLPAVGPTQYAPDLSQAIYYAPNIHAAAAGTNAVTVAFGQAANVVDLRILEYSGLDPASPLDQVAAASGKGAGPAATGPATIGSGRELLVGAGMSTDMFQGAGPSFTSRAMTLDGDMVEDRIVSSTGTYTAAAPLSAACEWVMQMATFR